jgi:regulator of sigma E protease
MVLTILVFLLILSVLVLIHEAGHFFVAKKFGIKVEEFGFGFPPRLYGKKFGETIYSINWLPIGGFVKLYGEDEAGGGSIKVKKQELKVKEDKRSFISRNAWQRAAVIVAGVVMNFVLAVVIISYLFTFVGVATPGNQVVVAEIAKNSPAQKAGLVANDIVLRVNNQKVTNPQQLIDYTKKHLGQEMTLQVQNANYYSGYCSKKTISCKRRAVGNCNFVLSCYNKISVVSSAFCWYSRSI